jgi:hypothetical protein
MESSYGNMVECQLAASISERLACIASYSGNVIDCVINYLLLSLSVYCWIVYENRSAGRSPPVSPSSRTQAFSFGFLVVFQFSLCFLLQCSGISIIWCGISGWMIMEILSFRSRQQSLFVIWYPLLLSAICNALGILYYFVTAEAITTVAHFCAILLGFILYWLSSRMESAGKWRFE